MAPVRPVEKLFLLAVLTCTLTKEATAALNIIQGRIVRSPQLNVESIPVVGIATVELGGRQTNRPNYYFNCVTNLNNGSGIRWSRMSAQNRFEVVEIPDGTPGMRMNFDRVDYPDLDVYTCSDLYSDDVVSVNITALNPAIMAAEETVGVVQGFSVELEIYISGYPMPSGSQIKWYHPMEHEILDTQTGVEFQDGNRTLVLSNIQPEEAGLYRCEVVLSYIPYMGATTSIQLNVYAPLMLYDGGMQEVNDLYSVEEHSRVRLECLGSGGREWTSSTGLNISYDTSDNVHQSYNASRDALSLVILNFTKVAIATYTCRTDLIYAQNDQMAVSVLITSSNPAVVIQSQVQYVLLGAATTLEARVFAFPTESAINFVQWYHQERLIDHVNEAQYTATSSGDIYRLTVDGVSENEIGEYTIIVNVNGVNATDGIMLDFPEPPLATIVPSSISVSEGDEVTLTCEAEGSGPLTVTWTMSDGSPLPVGVQENDNTLLIASASSSHPGTYVCSVSNLAGMSQDEVNLNVFYAPRAIITYNNMFSTSEQELYLEFDDNAPGPTILCSSGGYLPPTIEWVRENGRGLPSGISQIVRSNGEVLLRWQRPIEFTDSGSYHCQASNNVANSSASLELLVKIEPTINSIYPFNSIIELDPDTGSFTVPLSYVGGTLVCAARGWPAPEIEWYRNGRPLDGSSGVVSEPSAMAATVSARLMWTRKFNSTDDGSYECVIRKPNTEVPLTSQIVKLKAGPSASSLPPLACSIQQQSIDFQIRVLGTSCGSWEGVRSEDIANELQSVVRTECNCEIEDSDLQVLGSAKCSTKISGAAVFRGHIQSDSQHKTEQIYCSLFQWQQKTSLISINDQPQAVDTTCSLRVNTSPNSEECAAPVDSASIFGTVEIAIAVGVVAGVILISVIVVVIILAVCCCRYRKRSKGFDVNDGGSDHVYSRTDSFTRHQQGVITQRTPDSGEEPVYSTLTTNVPSYTENIPLGHFPSDSIENLLPESKVDIGVRPPQSMAKMHLAEAYQIPVSSQENLASPAQGSVNNFQAMKRVASSTSGCHSTSHKSSSIRKVESSNVTISATSPWNDYEHIDGDDAFTPTSSFCDSPIILEGRSQGRLHSAGSIGGGLRLSPQSSQRHNRAGMSASVPMRINPTQMGATVFTVVEEDTDDFRTQATGSHQVLNNGRPDMTTSSRQAHIISGDGHSPNESTASSSPHIMKQALMTQFPSVDHMAAPRAGRESNCSEAPPPYTSRPSSEAVPMGSDSADSSLMDNVPCIGVDSRQRLWYQASNLSLDSSILSSISPAPNSTSSTTGEHIKPYAIVRSEQIPYPSHKTSAMKLNNESSAVIMRRSSKDQQQKFQVQSPVQPYAEPMRSSIASLGRAQDSPTFFEVVV